MVERRWWEIEYQTMEQELREKFAREAKITKFDLGYISLPWANELIESGPQRKAAKLLAEMLREPGIKLDKVLGIPHSGVALASLVSDLLDLPLAPARKGNVVPGAWTEYIYFDDPISSPTTREPSRFIINGLQPGDTVALVDDILARGTIASHIAKNLAEKGITTVLGVYCAKLFQGGVDKLRELGIPVVYLYGVERIFIDGRMNLSPPYFGHNGRKPV